MDHKTRNKMRLRIYSQAHFYFSVCRTRPRRGLRITKKSCIPTQKSCTPTRKSCIHPLRNPAYLLLRILQKTPKFSFSCQKICTIQKKVVPLHDFSCKYAKNTRIENNIKIYNTMSKICQITGKKAMGGCNVSHSKRRTKRSFDVNLFRRKFYWVEQDVWIELNVSAAGLRTINKIGLDNALKQAAEKGYLY